MRLRKSVEEPRPGRIAHFQPQRLIARKPMQRICEGAHILRRHKQAFDAFTDAKTDFYPAALRGEIDEVNAFVYANVNNGVYRAGFASTQAAYEAAFRDVFGALDTLEQRLSRRRYLAGSTPTEADWRMFVTLVRFDAAYHGQFKCNLRRLSDYPNLSNYLRDLYAVPGVAATVDLQHIKQGYYRRRPDRNPGGVVPLSLIVTAVWLPVN